VVDWQVVGAGVVDLVAAEGFFEFCEAVPRVFRVVGGGYAPKIEEFFAGGAGIHEHLR